VKHQWAIYGVVVCLLPATAAGQSPELPRERLPLDTAIRLAVEHNRQIQSAKLQAQTAEENVATAQIRRLPTFEVNVLASQLLTPVDFSFPSGAFGDLPGVGPIPPTDTTLTTPQQPILFISSQMSQPLTQLVRINLGVEGAVATRDLERERVREQQLSVVNSVKRLYFAIQQSESAIKASDEAVALYRELDRTLAVRVAQKVALRSDALDVGAKLAQEEYTRMTRVNALDSQKEQLNQLLGRDVRTAFDTETASDISIFDVDLRAAQASALDRRPDVIEARLKVKQAHVDRELKKAERIPDVGVVLSYNSNFNIDVLPRNMAAVGVQLKWEPFDWGRKGRELAVKSHALNQARLAVRETEGRAIVDINMRFRKLGETRALLKVAESAQNAAREKLRVKTNQFQVQSALLTDVLSLRAELANTNDRYEQALASFWTAKADFEQAIGEDVIP
jgi:outer membrane protein TolC